MKISYAEANASYFASIVHASTIGRKARHGKILLWQQNNAEPRFARTLRAAQRGDEECFAQLWRQFHPALYRYLRASAGNAAEDLAADTWLQVARTLSRFEGDEPSFRGWLFTIARHRHIDWRRSQARHRESIVESRQLESVPNDDDTHRLVEESRGTDRALMLIASLPPDQAEAVALRVIAGLDVARVAEMMGRSPGAVRVLTHRGLRTLAAVVQEQEARAEVRPPTPDGTVV